MSYRFVCNCPNVVVIVILDMKKKETIYEFFMLDDGAKSETSEPSRATAAQPRSLSSAHPSSLPLTVVLIASFLPHIPLICSQKPCPHALYDTLPYSRVRSNMSSKGWFNLETAAGTIPETQFFEGDSAFKALGLTRTQRLYGFAGWYVRSFGRSLVSGYTLRLILRRAGLASAQHEPIVVGRTTFVGLLIVDFSIAAMLLDWSLASSEP